MAGRLRSILRVVLAIVMVGAGANHFIAPGPYVNMMPEVLPWHRFLVAFSGVAEIAGGLGLLWRPTRRLAAWGLIALYVAVFPANVNMAVNHLQFGGSHVASWMQWARLPLQALAIAWAYWVRQDASPSAELVHGRA